MTDEVQTTMTPEAMLQALMGEITADMTKERASKAKKVIRSKMIEIAKTEAILAQLKREFEVIKADFVAGGDGTILSDEDEDDIFVTRKAPVRRSPSSY